jgi:hypothetical protein
LETTFGGILILAEWLTLPGVNDEGTEVHEGLLANLGLGAVAKELGGGAAASDVFLERAEKFTVGFATVGVTDLGLSADVELGTGSAVVNGRCVRVDVVRGDGFVASEDIEGRELCLMVSLQYFALWHTGVLCCLGEGTFNDVRRKVAEEASKPRVIRLALNSGSFV